MKFRKAQPHYPPARGKLLRRLPPSPDAADDRSRLATLLRPLLTDDEDGSDEKNSPCAGEGARVLPVGGLRARGLAFLEGPVHDGHLEAMRRRGTV